MEGIELIPELIAWIIVGLGLGGMIFLAICGSVLFYLVIKFFKWLFKR